MGAFMWKALLTSLGVLQRVLHHFTVGCALVFPISMTVSWLIDVVEIHDGLGRHIDSLGPDLDAKARLELKDEFVFELFFHTATGLSKFAM